VTLYRRLLRISNNSQIEELRNEITDRFGALPDVLRFLFDITLIRNTGAQFGIDEVTIKRSGTTVKGDSEKLKILFKNSRKWILSSGEREKCIVTAISGANSFGLVHSLAEILK